MVTTVIHVPSTSSVPTVGSPRPIDVSLLGDAAIVVRIGAAMPDGVDADVTTMLVRSIADAIGTEALPGVIDIVPSPDRVTLVADPRRVPGPSARGIDSLLSVLTRIAHAAAATAVPRPGRQREIDVAYGGDDGPDLDQVCTALGIDRDTFVRLHTAPDYLVTAIGFVPGFPYLAGLPESLVLPRRDSPRTRVPAGSIGIGGRQTGIYPFATPGGWHLVGRTTACLFDPGRTPPSLLQVGDRVRFVASKGRAAAPRPSRAGDRKEPASTPRVGAGQDEASPQAASAPTPRGRSRSGRYLTILGSGLLTTVQDLGRFGHRAMGMPAGGAADPVSLRLANLVVGNPANAAGLECTLTGPEIRFDCDATIAVTGATVSTLPPGRPIHVERGTVLSLGHVQRGCRAYLAIAGGIDVDPVLDSRSTYLPATLGGVAGRALAQGDVVPLGTVVTRTTGTDWSLASSLAVLPEAVTVLRVVRDSASRLPVDAWQMPYRTTSRSDRMGVRLEGPSLPGSGSGTSIAVLPGTVQVPPDGRPIILLADAQTIGGYDVLGQVIAADLPLAAQLRPGDAVRLVSVDARTADDALHDRDSSLARAEVALASRTVRIKTIDLNADVGEGASHDAAIIPLVSSINIACGGHAGDRVSMRDCVARARGHGVAVGAHPGYADRATFGRVASPIEPDDAADLVTRQVEALAAIADDDMAHVKLHGALYHQVAHDADLAAAVASRLACRWPRLRVIAPAGSLFAEVAATCGLHVLHEAFVDRAYGPDGRLVPRSRPGAVLADPASAAAQAVAIARDGRVTVGGDIVGIRADTLCIHGDGVDPVACLRAVRRALAIAGIDVARP
ncbi:MAG: 5-oxoprolinase subunit PxpB [Planctomycetaceae bacterium]